MALGVCTDFQLVCVHCGQPASLKVDNQPPLAYSLLCLACGTHNVVWWLRGTDLEDVPVLERA